MPINYTSGHRLALSGGILLMPTVCSEPSRVLSTRNRSSKYAYIPSAQQKGPSHGPGNGPKIPRHSVKSRATLQPSMNVAGTGGRIDERVTWSLNSFLLPDIGQWSKFTDNLVRLSTFVFVFLLVPQLVQNGLSMAAGNVQALSILAWQAYGMGLFGNTLLLSYFLEREEGSAAMVQVVGIASNTVMLLQIFLSGFMPVATFYFAGVVTFFTAFVSACKATGRLSHGYGKQIWQGWLDFLGLLGIAGVLQAIWSTFSWPGNFLPVGLGLTIAASFLFLDRTGRLPRSLTGAWSRIPALSATFLFGIQPLPQLAKNVADPSSLSGVNAGSLLLGMMGNGLMAPRALFLGDVIWLTSSSWACVTSWAQLLTLFLGRSSTGARYLSEPIFIPLTLILLAYISLTVKCNANAKGLLTPWASMRYLLTGTMDEPPSASEE